MQTYLVAVAVSAMTATVSSAGSYFHGGESGAKGPVPLASQKRFTVPLVTERKDGRVVALLESDLYSASGFEKLGLRFNNARKTVDASSCAVSSGDGHAMILRPRK